MDALTAIEFNSNTVFPSVVNGVTTTGLYGLIAVSLVLSYRISRTIAFVHGGIVMAGCLIFWYLTSPNFAEGDEMLSGLQLGNDLGRPELPRWPILIMLLIGGALVAAGYGYVITSSKLATYPKVTLTNFSLALMLIMVGVIFKYNTASGEPSPSPFGAGKFFVGIQVVTHHQVATLIILASTVVGFTILMQKTRFGVYVRSVADNVEAAKLVGVPIGYVGTTVYAFSGVISALGGVLLGGYVGTDTTGILFIFLRALIVCVLGAFSSIPLALAGSAVLATFDSMMKSDVFGTVGPGMREFLVVGMLFSVVILIDRFGKKSTSVLAGH